MYRATVLGIAGFAANVTLFLPGAFMFFVLGYLLRRTAGAILGASSLLGWAAVASFGIVLAATLTPLRDGAVDGSRVASGCDFSRVGFASPAEILKFDDSIRNVVLFVPPGLVLAFVPAWRRRLALLASAAVLPIFIETGQLLLVPLHRACQSADVFDNVAGLAAGFAIGTLVAGGASALRRQPPRDDVD